MKMDQNTTQTSTALFRNTTGVDTTETNSLCCAAAGIIAPLSATTEALIPHEKLRGAALVDATLNAQKRPLAQPVMGYKPLKGTPYVIFDFGMRMLTPRELYRAKDFPDNYVIDVGHDGHKFNKRAQVQMVGNSTSPQPIASLIRANMDETTIEQMEAA